MMRNKELKIYTVVIVALMTAVVLLCLRENVRLGIAVFFLTLLAVAAAMLLQGWRYRRLKRMADMLDRILSGDFTLDIGETDEGELNILKSKIYKVTVMLSEQAQLLKKDKLLLADALSDISHQLKTPLTSMLMMAELLEEDTLPKERRAEFLGRLQTQLERLQWLVSSLLKLSRLDAGAVEFQKRTVALTELADKALEPLRIPAELKKQRIDLTGMTGAAACIDPQWTTEAVINILKNCLEHTPEGGTLSLGTEDNPIYTALVIRDTGTGIDREDLPHIFERFYKGKNSSPDSVGIGLAMAKEIIGKQGGEITVKSTPGEGTEFKVKFYRLMTV